jgi:hypothetical protein
MSMSVIRKVRSARIRVRLRTRFIATCPCPAYEIWRMSVSVKNVRVEPYTLRPKQLFRSSWIYRATYDVIYTMYGRIRVV